MKRDSRMTNGEQMKAEDEDIMINLRRNGKTVRVRFVKCADLDVPLLLGLDFLKGNSAVIDFEKNLLLIGKHDIRATVRVTTRSNVGNVPVSRVFASGEEAEKFPVSCSKSDVLTDEARGLLPLKEGESCTDKAASRNSEISTECSGNNCELRSIVPSCAYEVKDDVSTTESSVSDSVLDKSNIVRSVSPASRRSKRSSESSVSDHHSLSYEDSGGSGGRTVICDKPASGWKEPTRKKIEYLKTLKCESWDEPRMYCDEQGIEFDEVCRWLVRLCSAQVNRKSMLWFARRVAKIASFKRRAEKRKAKPALKRC